MEIIQLREREASPENPKLDSSYSQFRALLHELNKKQLTEEVVEAINQEVAIINTSNLEGNELRKLVKSKQTGILSLVEKAFKIVPKNYYRNQWLALGMTAFGLPIGVAFGMSIGNIGLMAVGLPIGMSFGLAVGMQMDKKAAETGKQLDIEIK